MSAIRSQAHGADRRALSALVLALVSQLACDDSRAGSSTEPTRAQQTDEQPSTRAPEAPLIARLAGTWTATIETARYGLISANVTITSDRWLLATGQVLGVPQSAHARIESLSSDQLIVRYQGRRHAVPIEFAGDRLLVTLPVVGDTAFTRH